MKKLPYIIGIPFIAVVLVLGGAMLWKIKNQASNIDVVNTAPRGTMPNALGNAGGGKPTKSVQRFIWSTDVCSDTYPDSHTCFGCGDEHRCEFRWVMTGEPPTSIAFKIKQTDCKIGQDLLLSI